MVAPPVIDAIAAKLLWPFLGAVLALLVIPPKTRGEAWRRGVVSMTAGWIGGGTLREWLNLTNTPQNEGFALALAAFLSWWILGALPKASTRWLSRDDAQ